VRGAEAAGINVDSEGVVVIGAAGAEVRTISVAGQTAQKCEN
jgi:hypothetical protein